MPEFPVKLWEVSHCAGTYSAYSEHSYLISPYQRNAKPKQKQKQKNQPRCECSEDKQIEVAYHRQVGTTRYSLPGPYCVCLHKHESVLAIRLLLKARSIQVSESMPSGPK